MAGRRKVSKAKPARSRRKFAKPNRRAPARLGPADVRLLYERLRATIPAPRGELKHRSPFQLLVAVILSAQATDKSVNLATRPLFAAAATPEAMAALGVRGLEHHIRSIGLWRMKAKNVVVTSRLLLERHGGAVPRERAALEALPGVGRKTANIVLNVAFGEPTIAVDTHVFRVANRTGLAPGKDVRAVEDGLIAVTPPEFALHAHHWLILHGRYTCTARKPKCPECPIRDICLWPDKTLAAAVPISFSGRTGP